MQVVLGLGSNKTLSLDGGKELSCAEILFSAVQSLKGVLDQMEISSVYKTRAMYVTDQDDFYNMCVAGDTSLGPRELLNATQKIEASHGRDRTKEVRFGPRSLDIDIELFGAKTVRQADLEIPHPRLKERAFVLVPLLEILGNSSDNNKWKDFDSFFIRELHNSFSALNGREDGVEKYMSAGDFSKGFDNGTGSFGKT